MLAGVGYSDIPDSAAAGKQAAGKAVAMSGRSDPCDLVLLFCTIRHNQQALREAVASVVGSAVPVYGGGAIGLITNDAYGYAGDQVGLACLWLDGVRCDVLTEGGLYESEEAVGGRLGRGLAGLGVTPASPVMLFYDAVSRLGNGDMRLIMATWILAGLEKALGFLPDLTGAGLQGDFIGSLTSQYTGAGLGQHQALALAFSGDIRIDSVVMHGCRPASLYYTVTKADGPVILEINNQPALAFMDSLLGSFIKPEAYPFSLLFGLNFGERWGEYDERNYASRLCLGLDRERGGIIMFEPDMLAGTEFQIMFRSFDLAYMKPKLEALFAGLNGRTPVFALYIDCAGRCAGYSGTDWEDALVIQQTVAGRVPVLGIYSGVEIAAVAGRPRGLDFTGVFCLFSQGGGASLNPGRLEREGAAEPAPLDPAQNTPLAAASRLCVQNAAKILELDYQSIKLRYELELKRQGFRLISELAVSLRQAKNYQRTFIRVAQRVNAALNMHKTFVWISDGGGRFKPAVLQGFTPEEKKRLSGQSIELPREMLGSNPTLITGEDDPERFRHLRREYNLPYFIAAPVIMQGEVIAVLVTGRLVEQPPYFTRLSRGDLETVNAIAELLGSVLIRLRLHEVSLQAETDGLTGLLNRGAFKRLVEDCLNGGEESSGAFMMVDVDHFKSVNDTYGHLTGDNVLKSCTEAILKVLRDSDIIGRQGGDEFVVFCRGIKNIALAEKKAAQICEAWKTVTLEGGRKQVTASIGVALFPQHGATFQELFDKADAALYRAKERGRNGYVLSD